MLSLHVYETIPFCRMVNLHFPIVEIPFPYISSPKTKSVDLFCFGILMSSSVQSLMTYLCLCAKFGDLCVICCRFPARALQPQGDG